MVLQLMDVLIRLPVGRTIGLGCFEILNLLFSFFQAKTKVIKEEDARTALSWKEILNFLNTGIERQRNKKKIDCREV